VSNSSLITKIYLPREIFPIASILSKMVDLLLSIIILVIFMIFFGVNLHLTILFVPVIFIFQMILITGASLILSSVNVFFRDVENVLGVLLTVWMYLTPIVYPAELIPNKFVPIFNLNLMMPIINSYRNVILYGVLPPWQSLTYSAIFSLFLFIFGYIIFKQRSKYFADVI